jgi:hypothetical protein
MSVISTPVLGLTALALCAAAAGLIALLRFNVKVQSVSRRLLGFRVYDWNADMKLPMRSRSYQIALYVTMKSLPREPSAPRVGAPAASPSSPSRAPRAV